MPGPLHGLGVLDFSTLLPGPMATLMLAEAGAEVIKIERPGMGDEIRTYAPQWGPDSAIFALLNRGKKSIALDLKIEADRARLMPLIATADILVEQFRPGVMDRLGLGFESISAINPRIIYCSITGYGQTGPKRNAAGHDLNYIGDAGLLALSMGPAAQPVVPPALIADIAGGTYPAIINILLALRERDRTGLGSHLDIAMAEGVLPFTFWALGEGLVTGEWPGSGSSLLSGGTPRYRLYPTSDGRCVAAAPIEQRFWQSFVTAIDLPNGLRDDTLDPNATGQAVAAIIAEKPAEHWRAVFANADCCCTIVQSLEEAVGDPHFHSRGVFDAAVQNAAGEGLTAVPVPIVPQFRVNGSGSSPAPALGQHNGEILD